MNIGRVAEYIVLHNQGKTYEEIGEQFGVAILMDIFFMCLHLSITGNKRLF